MEFVPVERESGAFQEGLTADVIVGVCARLLGEDASGIPHSVVELPGGTYNSTYRLGFGSRPPLILRAAPRVDERGDEETFPMRNDFAASAFFSVLGALAPRTVAADFTRQIVDRDVVLQGVLPGRAASDCISGWSSAQRRHYYRELGEVVRRVHSVEGERFGRLVGPTVARCSDWIRAELTGLAARMLREGLDDTELMRVVDAISEHESTLDLMTSPRLLHNDLWNLNVLVDDTLDQPRITGVVDFDGARWGDPLADLPIHAARLRARSEADAFWDGYGPLPADDGHARIRALFYQARLLIGARLDIHRRRLNLASIPNVHWDLAPVLAELDLLRARD